MCRCWRRWPCWWSPTTAWTVATATPARSCLKALTCCRAASAWPLNLSPDTSRPGGIVATAERVKRVWKAWSRKEELRLEEMRIGGMTCPAIAAAMGRTLVSVKHRLQDLGVHRASKLQLYLPLVSKPHTLQGVAAVLGRAIRTVTTSKNALRRAGFALYSIK